MKQKIRVIGLIRNEDDEILLLKKRMGREEGTVLWELPTGKIKYGEQPEEAIARTILEYLGVQVASVELKDVITFIGLEGASQLNNLFIVYNICVQHDNKIEPTIRYSAYKYVKIDGGGGLCLADSTLSVLAIEREKLAKGSAENVSDKIGVRGIANGASIFVDGASRGNPGPAGLGYYITSESGEILKKGGEFLGFATSRVAEYYAMKEGCEQAIELGLKTVKFISDNLMMINQLNGIFEIKNTDIVPIYNDIRELLKKFDAVAFVHVKRNQNLNADREANLAIDRHFDKSMLE